MGKTQRQMADCGIRRLDRTREARTVMTKLALAAFIIAVTVGINASGEDKPAAAETGSDLLWKKVESRIDEIAMRFDGVMGIAIVDLTDGQPALLRNAEHV